MGPMGEQIKSAVNYRTRFAPSPTGPLHFGSLVTAVGSWVRAASLGGTWVMRCDDLDRPRVILSSIGQQFQTLHDFGLDTQEPLFDQHGRVRDYRIVLKRLLAAGLAYPCACSSKDLRGLDVYPGTCRNGLPPGKSGSSIRFKTNGEKVSFEDSVQGKHTQVPSEQVGDFIIKRGDGIIAYQLAVVVDDIYQNITEVVRGSDLLDSVGRQCLLYDALGKPRPYYLHLPLIVDRDGRKLSKSDNDDPITSHNKRTTMRLALRALGHEVPPGIDSVSSMLDWARLAWNVEQVPKGPISIADL